MSEASGASYDPKFLLLILLLSFGEFIVYLDYGQHTSRLIPGVY